MVLKRKKFNKEKYCEILKSLKRKKKKSNTKTLSGYIGKDKVYDDLKASIIEDDLQGLSD